MVRVAEWISSDMLIIDQVVSQIFVKLRRAIQKVKEIRAIRRFLVFHFISLLQIIRLERLFYCTKKFYTSDEVVDHEERFILNKQVVNSSSAYGARQAEVGQGLTVTTCHPTACQHTSSVGLQTEESGSEPCSTPRFLAPPGI